MFCGTVGCFVTREIVALHNASEAATLHDAGNVNHEFRVQRFHADSAAQFDAIDNRNFAQEATRCDIGFFIFASQWLRGLPLARANCNF